MRVWLAGLLIVMAGVALVFRQFWLAGGTFVAGALLWPRREHRRRPAVMPRGTTTFRSTTTAFPDSVQEGGPPSRRE